MELRFPYNKQINERLKKLKARWSPELSCWTLYSYYIEEFEEEFKGNIYWEKDIKQIWDENDIDLSVIDSFKLKPYTYQMVGGSAFLPKVKTALLADEVGLGKTVQVFVAFQQLYNQKKVKKALVFCKKSLVLQWLSELEKFTDLKGIAISGTPEERKELYKEAAKEEYQFVFLNYELLIHDYQDVPIEGYKKKVKIIYDPIKELVENHVDVLVLDEAQRIKNYKAQQTKQMRRLKDLTEYRWLLSGTPLENSPEDIFNLFVFMNDKIFGKNPISFRNRYMILGRFKQPLGTKNLDELHRLIAPYMLRRLQSQVDHEFPELRIDEVVLVMSDLQKKLHEEIQDSIYKEIKGLPNDYEEDQTENPEGNSTLGKFALLMQVANNPSLLETSDSAFAQKVLKKLKPNKTQLAYSPKYDWVLEFLNERRELNPKAKTIIFSRYERVISELAKILNDDKFSVVTHTGKMSQEEREGAKKAFWEDAQVFLSTDAGAEGVNLQIADCLINIELPWTPSRFIQRWGRIKRAGSEHNKVRVINLICKDSIDERVKQIFYNKEYLFNQIVEGSEEEKKKINKITKNVLLKLVSKRKSKKS